MALFYIYAHLFNIWLNRKQLDSHVLLHSLCHDLIHNAAFGKLRWTRMSKWAWKRQINPNGVVKTVLTLQTFWKSLLRAVFTLWGLLVNYLTMREHWEKESQTGVSEFEDPFTIIGKRSKNKKMSQAFLSLGNISIAYLSLWRNLTPLKNSRSFGQ